MTHATCVTPPYGLSNFSDLFTNRQLTALTTHSVTLLSTSVNACSQTRLPRAFFTMIA